jgi:hypothetical protein
LPHVSDGQTSGTFTLKVSDKTGTLNTTAVTGGDRDGRGHHGTDTQRQPGCDHQRARNPHLRQPFCRQQRARHPDIQGASGGSDAISVNATDANGNGDPDVSVTIAAPAVSPPVLTTPATFSAPAGSTGALTGVSVADQSSTGTFTATVSDSHGILNTTAISGVTALGEGTTSITLSGSLSAINAELATLTYKASNNTGWHQLL